MKNKEYVELKDLVGLKKLSGLDVYEDEYNTNGYLFVLDGVTYLVTEDEDDGYRSYLNDVEIVKTKVNNTFKPCKVVCKMREEFDSDVLDMIDIETSLTVLSIGTEDTNDYYPCCIMEWKPQNMSINN